MKRDVVEYVARCLTCQQVKAEHQRPGGMLQPLEIPKQKWEEVTMDFMSRLSRSSEGYNSIWVIMDQMTKSAYFLPIKTTSLVKKLARLYLKEIVRLHGVLVSIVSDRDARFTSMFWKELQVGFGTRLKFSRTSHPQTDGQSERTIQTLEDMLRVCMLDFPGSWAKNVPLMEFAYNNNYHQSLGMPPCEVLYGRKCRSPIH